MTVSAAGAASASSFAFNGVAAGNARVHPPPTAFDVNSGGRTGSGTSPDGLTTIADDASRFAASTGGTRGVTTGADAVATGLGAGLGAVVATGVAFRQSITSRYGL